MKSSSSTWRPGNEATLSLSCLLCEMGLVRLPPPEAVQLKYDHTCKTVPSACHLQNAPHMWAAHNQANDGQKQRQSITKILLSSMAHKCVGRSLVEMQILFIKVGLRVCISKHFLGDSMLLALQPQVEQPFQRSSRALLR